MRLACATSIAMSLLLAATGALADAADQQFFTDFQDLDEEDPNDFDLGPAHFMGADEFDVGDVSELYNGDDRAWILGPGKMATIEFDVPITNRSAYGLTWAGIQSVPPPARPRPIIRSCRPSNATVRRCLKYRRIGAALRGFLRVLANRLGHEVERSGDADDVLPADGTEGDLHGTVESVRDLGHLAGMFNVLRGELSRFR